MEFSKPSKGPRSQFRGGASGGPRGGDPPGLYSSGTGKTRLWPIKKLSADFPKSSGLVKKLAVAYKKKLLAQPSPAWPRPAGSMASLPAREARRKK